MVSAHSFVPQTCSMANASAIPLLPFPAAAPRPSPAPDPDRHAAEVCPPADQAQTSQYPQASIPDTADQHLAKVASALFASARETPVAEIKVIAPSRVRKSSYTFHPVPPTLNSHNKVCPDTSGAAPELRPSSRLVSNSAPFAREAAAAFVATYPSSADVTPKSRKNSRRSISHPRANRTNHHLRERTPA